MNVKEVMSREVRSVRMGERLDAVARVLWEHDCGIVPIVDSANVLVGVLTDRDLCMAAYTQGRVLSDIAVTSVMARAVRTCKPDDSITTVLGALQQAQVHRLPVVDIRGICVGIVAVNDLIRLCQSRPTALDAGTLVKAIAAITAPRNAEKAPAPTATKAVTVVAASSSPPAPAPANTAPIPPKPAASPAPPPVVTPKPAVLAPAKADKPKPNASGKGKKG